MELEGAGDKESDADQAPIPSCFVFFTSAIMFLISMMISRVAGIMISRMKPIGVARARKLAETRWSAWENSAYLTKKAVIGKTRSWSLNFTEKDVPYSYSVYKWLMEKAYSGSPVTFEVKHGGVYDLDEVNVYVVGGSLRLDATGAANVREVSVTVQEA